jgi:hypothetical protein
MSFGRSSLRVGVLLAAAGALLLAVLMFAVKWYGPGAIAAGQVVATSINGWHALTHLRWLMVLTVASVLALVIVAATTRRRALRVALSAIVTLLGLASLLWLGYRVFISIPPGQKPAAYIAVACAVAIFLGGGLSAYEEWTSENAAPPGAAPPGAAPPSAAPPSAAPPGGSEQV